MKTTVILIIACWNTLTAAYAQQDNDTTMIERYNFEATDNGTKRAVLNQREWIIDIHPKPNLSQKEYAPAKDLYMIYKEYYGSITNRVGNQI